MDNTYTEMFYDCIINKLDNKYFKYYPSIVDKIYYNEFYNYTDKDYGVIENRFSLFKKIDPEIDFILNKDGFRSPEFKENIDFLIAGCSNTMGDGLRTDKIWYELLLKDSKYTYNSIAQAGESINSQVEKIFTYIKKYNNPKNILFLMPNFERIKIFNSPMFFTSHKFENYISTHYESNTDIYYTNMDDKTNINYSNKSIDDLNSSIIFDNQNEIKYFKRPLLAEEVIPIQMAHMYSAQSINILETYCKKTNINLLYGTWDLHSNELLKKLSNDNNFTNFIDLENNNWVRKNLTDYPIYIIDSCHREFIKDIYFNVALDYYINEKESAHLGFHRHIHIRDIFAKQLNDRYGYDFKV
jgi:hypothetical protein